ncbi:YecA/YgfB family protein [Aliivibrio wodanis]|uniref:YecA/YgfB family protein n=1 Tax=Aliivibrio wodanis TaxID=80852 RepID=UPI00406D4C63
MSEIKMPKFLAVESALQDSKLAVTPSELHGLLVGMISGGLSLDDQTWKPLIFDYTNDGMGWPDSALKIGSAIFQCTVAELSSDNFALDMLIPDVKETLMNRADGLSEWVNHFISGLGLVELKLDKGSESLKEALLDLEEIARLGIDEDDDLEEQEALFEQVMEHVRICVLTIHAELGQKVHNDASKTVH